MFWLAPVIAAFLAFTSQDAQDLYTLKVEVPVVSVDVTVTDANGSLINDLTKADFQILEDGVPQDIRFFSPVSAPYNVFLLFDRSGSTRDRWSFMQKAVARFIEDLRPQDRVALGSFDEKFDVNVAWTSDRAKVVAALDKVIYGHDSDGTRFYSALDRTLRREFKNVVGRRAVVVLTDGKDTDYLFEEEGDFRKVFRASQEQRIPVYIVALYNEADSRVIFQRTRQYLIETREIMQLIADRSGGQVLYPKTLDDVARMYEQIGRALGTSYSLGYISSNHTSNGRVRKVEVKTGGKSYRLTQSRTEYALK
jgi:Ca-activated chloride channel homolog